MTFDPLSTPGSQSETTPALVPSLSTSQTAPHTLYNALLMTRAHSALVKSSALPMTEAHSALVKSSALPMTGAHSALVKSSALLMTGAHSAFVKSSAL